MKREQVAAQLYTVRDHLKTPADIARSLRTIHGIGYRAVQVSGVGDIAYSELAKIIAGEGLTCCATHESGDAILNNPASIVDRLRQLNCIYTAYPYPAGIDFASEASVQALIARLDAATQVLASAGMVLTYHNHNMELRRMGGRTILEAIYQDTRVQGEIDTYWVQAGGGDPTAWCRRLRARLPLLHMKDFGVDEKNQPTFREIGAGNLDWRSIVSEAQESGCRWFIVEQDGGWANGNPFDSLRASFEYITSTLCS